MNVLQRAGWALPRPYFYINISFSKLKLEVYRKTSFQHDSIIPLYFWNSSAYLQSIHELLFLNIRYICANWFRVYTDRTQTSFQHEVRQIVPYVKNIHCVIHWVDLLSRDLEPKLHSVLQETVEVVNSIKAHQFNTRLISDLWQTTSRFPLSGGEDIIKGYIS
jgi:hypothetical protein